MSGQSKKSPTEFQKVFGRLIASFFRTEPDSAFRKAQCREYEASLGKYPLDVLNNAIDEAKETFKWMPDIASMSEICKKIIERRGKVLSASERQAELEAEGERCKTDFIEAWSKLARFNRWEIERLQEEAENTLVNEGFPRDFLFGRRGEPGILIRQKTIELARKRGVI